MTVWEHSNVFGKIVSVVVCAASLVIANRLVARPRADAAVALYGIAYEQLLCLAMRWSPSASA